MALIEDYGCHLRLHRFVFKSPFYVNHSRNLYTDSFLLKFPSITFGCFESKCLMLKNFHVLWLSNIFIGSKKKKKILRDLLRPPTVAYKVASGGRQMFKLKTPIQTMCCPEMTSLGMPSFILDSKVTSPPMDRLLHIHRNWYLNLEFCTSLWAGA